MSLQRSLPVRYIVVVHGLGDASWEYSVVTWLNVGKAIALAIQAHLRRFPDANEVYDVEVEELGPLPVGEQGPLAIERGDLFDRHEW